LTDPATGGRVSAGTFSTKAGAEKAFVNAIAAQDKGNWVSPRTTLTLADYSAQWLASRLTSNGDRLRPRVRELYEGLLRLHILPSLGRVSLSKLRTTTVRSWYAALTDGDLQLMVRARAGGWNLVAVDLGIDLATAAGEFMANVMASAAQWERRIIGQRTKDALAIRRAQGVRLGRPPLLPAEVVARVLAARRSGAGWSAIARDLDADGVPTAQAGVRWYPATVRAVYFANETGAA